MQTNPPPTNLKPFFLAMDDLFEEYDGKLDWPTFFGNDNPVEIDVGCGRGLFVVTASEMHPERNFLGIEIDFREGRRGAARLKRRNLTNACVIGGDANVPFTKMIEPHSVDAIHVYFPDPWWKRKHRSRRVFNDVFVNLCSNLLVPGGLLHSWTDVEEYFEDISALMNHHEDFESLPTPEERDPEHDMDYQTSYERKKRKLGLPIHRGKWQRKPIS
ncbi:tRNA (guanosine(46)-N7)-methyltransferase TrmB [Thalassoglobus polymorphus]|uniref:tRNA (guanine-N(7)-)-methyltransferase n=1 Tax=Thalassoglobus polymorphus TaxID=2527994 RepID=A0A517QP60_9PLAN|nr:tRNA (guanosine(46)-N7)-methyltransferase TrmB [Thalassoglobus polymorphus]QDT33416.1 tRNA (guanine-N(7)-)-methyltransferase [Thalassoglobus polymorphus]